MPTTPPENRAKRRSLTRRVTTLFLLLLLFVLLRRGLLVASLGLKILGYTTALDSWQGPVRHQTVSHAGIPIDIYGEDSYSPILIVHGVNPTGKNSLDLMRVSEALAQVGYQVFVPDFIEMRRQHLQPEEASQIKSAFQFIGKDAGIACFSYGCGPALIAAADPEIRTHVRFALAFGGYFDIREALEFVVTGPESPVAYLKWVYLAANSDVIANEEDQERLRKIAEHNRLENSLDAADAEGLSPEAKALLDIFTASKPEDFRARLNDGPEGLRLRLDALSPSRIVHQIHAPLILVHGINDPVIPAEQTVKLADAARKNGLECSLTLLRMYGHVHPVLPDFGVSSIFGFYLPESVRFLRVVNRVIASK